MEELQKQCEWLEKERQNERQQRLKLEDEYAQNTKNHEEEVQLRLKFESKLNNMHSAHRDLETKYKRTRQDLKEALSEKDTYHNSVNMKIDEIAVLKTLVTELDSKLASAQEKNESQARDLRFKAEQVREYEHRLSKTNDELDLTKYKLQDL